MNLCKNCTFFVPGAFSSPYLFALCIKPRTDDSVNPITGEITKGMFCVNARASYGDCGPEGKLYESRA
jgi:hypothetical protein